MPGPSFRHARRLVAGVLVDFARQADNGRNRLSPRDIAAITGTDGAAVHRSLKALQEEGLVSIERNRNTI